MSYQKSCRRQGGLPVRGVHLSCSWYRSQYIASHFQGNVPSPSSLRLSLTTSSRMNCSSLCPAYTSVYIIIISMLASAQHVFRNKITYQPLCVLIKPSTTFHSNRSKTSTRNLSISPVCSYSNFVSWGIRHEFVASDTLAIISTTAFFNLEIRNWWARM